MTKMIGLNMSAAAKRMMVQRSRSTAITVMKTSPAASAAERQLAERDKLLREIRPTMPSEVIYLWCKDRDALLSSAEPAKGGDGEVTRDE